jgi:predicted metallopeptidase
MKIINIKSPSDFVIEIEMIVKDKNCEYMDAIMIYCERNNMEVETVADIIKHNSILKSKLQYEAEVMNMMKKTSRLPI